MKLSGWVKSLADLQEGRKKGAGLALIHPNIRRSGAGCGELVLDFCGKPD